MSEELMARALSTNAYTLAGGTGAAGTLNPTLWVPEVERFAKAATVVAPLGVVRNDILGKAGEAFNIVFDSEITVAALTETTAITPSALSYTKITLTPTEYGGGFAITRKERIRAITDVIADKVRDLGYAFAKKRDQVILAELVASAGNSVVANGVAVSAIASSDTLDTDDIANAVTELRVDDEVAKYLVIHPKCENSLIKLSDFVDASVYGGREVLMNGEIGKYLGLRVLVSTLVSRNATTSTAFDNFVLGDRAFVFAPKMPVTIDMDYKVLEREYVVAAVEEYDVSALRVNAICKLTAYGGA